MLEYRHIIGLLAGALSLAAYAPYVRAILLKRTIPNRATWLIWTVVGAMLCSSYYAGGAENTIWLAISYLLGPLIVFILSIKRGEGGWGLLDKICMTIAAISAIVWWYTGLAWIALAMNLAADAAGAIITIHKIYLKPETEDRLAWSLFAAGTTLNLFAIEDWSSAAIWAHPVYMFASVCAIAAMLWFQGRIKTADQAAD